MRFWLGGYTADMDGKAAGIGTLLAGAADDASAGGSLSFAGAAAPAPSPSWLAQHPSLDVVYAALEGIGKVAAFVRTGEATLARLGPAIEVGAAVCHIAVAPDGASLVASCYGDGRVVRMSLDADGAPSGPVTGASATDPYVSGPYDTDPYTTATDPHPSHPYATATHPFAPPDSALLDGAGLPDFSALHGRAPAADEGAALLRDFRASLAAAEQGRTLADVPAADEPGEAPGSDRASHAHSAAFLPGGGVATTDLGFDLVRIWRPTAAGLRPDHEVVLPRDSGPRHMVVHPSGHLHVVTEHSCEVFTLGRDREGRWILLGGASLSAMPGDTGAELTPSRDGDFLYAGLRGSNTIATLRVRGAGERVEPVALVESGVDWPRHHLVARDILLVAGQRSDDVASLTLDLRTGVPGRVRHRAEAPSPTALLPVRA
ncbi:MAG TPA: beta-propeller fold lactonase family protein [Microbacterium sp.]|uniref:lactonase family protein n=1 Tax=Microbacterium sp. TaxID=51671 RepID=UPI002CF28571|nr:beta-propeller fold lactonase family protein [Microbacterium sp.]HWI31166.1 beta-propeller fold lactonase family protein [Microbacterium sp.]